MCDPISIASGALLVGSTLAGVAQQGAVDSARDDAIRAERERQNKLRDEAAAALGKSENDFANLPENQNKAADDLASILNANTLQQQPNANLIPSASDPAVVREVQGQSQKSTDYTQQQGKARGKLRAFGDTLGEANRNLAGNAAWINTLGGFQQGSSNVLNSELAAANEAGSGWGTLGDLLGTVGGVGLNYGLSSGGPKSAPSTILNSAGLPPVPAPLPKFRGGTGPLPNYYG